MLLSDEKYAIDQTDHHSFIKPIIDKAGAMDSF
jgi:hypothetical protein